MKTHKRVRVGEENYLKESSCNGKHFYVEDSEDTKQKQN